MTSREIVKRTIDFAGPVRLAFDCFAYGKRYTDIITSYLDWEFQYERKSWIEGNREFYLDAWGNTWARVVTDKSTKGEIFRGALHDSWQALDSLKVPNLASAANNQRVRQLFDAYPDMFKVGCIYNASYGILHRLRGFANLMEDLIVHPQQIREACELIDEELTLAVEGYAACNADGLHIMEDWGTQDNALISRKMWEDLFAPGYRKLCDAAHRHDMRVILHSCGMVRSLIPAFIESGIDVLQFDQTANYGFTNMAGIEKLAEEFGRKVAFFCPVDIQHTLVTGDPAKIEEEARRLVQCLGGGDGGFIAKSYGRGCQTYLDSIGCDPRWNDLAFECFKKYGQEMFDVPFDIPQIPGATPPA
jgi:uroporphyrinogen decarboxylase